MPAPTTTTRFLASGPGSPVGPTLADAGIPPEAVLLEEIERSADPSPRPEPVLDGFLGGLLQSLSEVMLYNWAILSWQVDMYVRR